MNVARTRRLAWLRTASRQRRLCQPRLGALCLLALAPLTSCWSNGSDARELPPAPLPVDPAAGARPSISLEETLDFRGGARFAGPLESWKWAPDGLNLRRGTGSKASLVSPTTLEPIDQAPKAKDASETRGAEFATGAKGATQEIGTTAADLGRLLDLDEREAKRLARHPVLRSPDGGVQIFQHGGTLLVVSEDAGPRILVPHGDAEPELLELSPDASRLAFVRGRDFYCVSIETGELTAITDDQSPDQYDGILDWVYQEEIYGRGQFKGFWWSPNSRHVAFLSLDESDVYEFTVIDHIDKGNFRVTPEVTHYPKAGDPNPKVRIGLYDCEQRDLIWLDLNQYEKSQPLVVRLGWTPDGSHLLYTVQDRIQTWAEVVARNIDSHQRKVWIREESDSWVNRPPAPRWLADGSFLWSSERSGYRHLYHYAGDGSLLNRVTSGDWEVRKILFVSEEQEFVWFSASRDGAIDENVYRVNLDGSGFLRLTQGPGTHAVKPNQDGSAFLDRVSTRSQPPEMRLCNGLTGQVEQVLATSGPQPGDGPRQAKWELHQVPARDGFPLDVGVLKPLDFDPDRTYPVWLMTYSGPDTPTLSNRWAPSLWSQFLAQEGVIVLNVNVRSASRKGREVISVCYKQLLVQELMDIEDTVDWLTANPWADGDHVGLTGWSYGGSMTAYALTHSDRFALGIAGAGVYDLRMYDTIYTERYMDTPQANPEGYERSSVLAAAGNLKGHLLLLHGTKDGNVHLQNTIQLLYALERAGMTDFDLMLYPESGHGIRQRSQRLELRRREWNTIQAYLLGRVPRPRPHASAG